MVEKQLIRRGRDSYRMGGKRLRRMGWLQNGREAIKTKGAGWLQNGREAINTNDGWMFMVIEKEGVLETV